MTLKRAIFFISDSTAITVQTLGQSLLTQFEHIEFEQITLPFTDSVVKADNAVLRINKKVQETGISPIVFSTLIDPEIRQKIMNSNGVVFDFIETFISRLENVLSVQSSHTIGRFHGLVNDSAYNIRIDAVNYALGHDDGIMTKNYDRADVILIGVSRAGKTPTCIYMGMQFGIYAANYPLTEEDFFSKDKKVSHVLAPFRKKLFGLTINPDRLQKIRAERRPNSRYATLAQCQKEIMMAESLFVSEDIPFINITLMSVEEIAATIMHSNKLERRVL
jgi:[pyruvate, water dikinase]-phosphate phosphotransferase / [pyruvate, water dikinase] kinase